LRLKSELFLFRYLTGKHVPSNIEKVLDNYPLLRRFRETVMHSHKCPICGREFATQSAVMVHLLRDRKCSMVLHSLINAVINLENYRLRGMKLQEKLEELPLHI